MKWLENPPDDWDSAPEEPPTRTDGIPLEAEMLIHGFVHREGSTADDAGAYIYTSDGSVELDDWT